SPLSTKTRCTKSLQTAYAERRHRSSAYAMHKVIANGVRGTAMPAFAQSAGGMLTDKQITVIASGMFSSWGREGILDGSNPPSYSAKIAGNAAHGELVYGTYCASCHGPVGTGGPKASSIIND